MDNLCPPAALAVLILLPTVAPAVPSAEPWPRWERHDPDSAATIDHAAWTAFLRQYRSMGDAGIARLDYGAVRPADHRRLDGYIERLESTAISTYSRDEQRAYWINLYNALTIDVVLEHYPVESIMDIDISPGLFSDGPWGRKLVTVEEVALSLDEIEHRILRPIWRDPRIHYALNCAALGCPNLQPIAFTAANTEELLERGAHRYVNHRRGARIENGELVVSSLYEWFQADFGGSEAGVLAHLRAYAGPALRERLDGRNGYDDHEYDWTLNAA